MKLSLSSAGQLGISLKNGICIQCAHIQDYQWFHPRGVRWPAIRFSVNLKSQNQLNLTQFVFLIIITIFTLAIHVCLFLVTFFFSSFRYTLCAVRGGVSGNVCCAGFLRPNFGQFFTTRAPTSVKLLRYLDIDVTIYFVKLNQCPVFPWTFVINATSNYQSNRVC